MRRERAARPGRAGAAATAAWLLASTLPVQAAIPVDAAAVVFREAAALCHRDGGALWGMTLCGPILLVDPTDLSVVANQADTGGRLKASGGAYAGHLPATEIVANTPVEWSGTRWTELLWPLPTDESARHVMIAHELFHRIQPDLGMERGEAGNAHLDTLEGRYDMQLEWRALARALDAPTPVARRAAIDDALAFRADRHRRFPQAASDEGALEGNEGIAEYTGVKVGLETGQARVRYALHDLEAFVHAPSFVRSFAYATGPAYGLLLDDVDPAWRVKVRAGKRMDELLAAALDIIPGSNAGQAKARAPAYDDGALLASESVREQARLARLADLKERFVKGPVLELPLDHSSYQFNPQTLQPLDDLGTVYPTMRLSDAWGVLEVEDGALLDKGMKRAWVSARGLDASKLEGNGWRLMLKDGWAVVPGVRSGDLLVRRMR